MKKIITFILLLISASVFSGGRNDQVKYPEGYKNSFTYYNTQNRSNNKQIADMYANDIAINSVRSGTLSEGSTIIMEIHKPEIDEAGAPVISKNGLFIKKKNAAVAVMEKRNDWGADYPENERAGGWGFALYDTKGMPKKNNLDCAVCHKPLSSTDFMFTFPKLEEVANLNN